MEFVQVGSVFAGHRLEAVIGQGGMGIVYRATHLGLEREIALKVISPALASDPNFRERFKKESRTAASLHHPHIVTIHDAGEDQGLLYITMELVEGSDLRHLIRERGSLSPELATDLVAQVADALDGAHSFGLVHRDVKPANVLIQKRGDELRAYLTDFGLTRHVTSAGGITRTGQWVGTLDYVAPEQIQGESVDSRADTYALGCVLYEALSGEVPYPRDNDMAKMWAQVNDPPPVLSEQFPEIDPALSDIVRRAMSKDREERYPSSGDLAEAAAAAVENRDVERPERPVDSNRTRVAATRSADTAAATRPGSTPPSQPPGDTEAQPTRTLPAPAMRRWILLVVVAGLVAVATGLMLGNSGDDSSDAGEASSGKVDLSYGDQWQRYLGNVGVEGFEVADPAAIDYAELSGLGILRAGQVDNAVKGSDPLPTDLRERFTGKPERGFVTIDGDTWFSYAGKVKEPEGAGTIRVAMIATDRGYQGLACEAPVKPVSEFDAACETVISSLRLSGAKAIPPGPDDELGELLSTVLPKLAAAQKAQKKNLAADSTKKQAKAARSVAAAYEAQGKALEGYQPRPQDEAAFNQLVNSISALQKGYTALGDAAAKEDAGKYSAAEKDIAKAANQYDRAIASLKENGYRF